MSLAAIFSQPTGGVDIWLHAAVLIVVIPLLAGPIAVIMGRGRLAWIWSVLISGITFGLSLVLLNTVLAGGTITYEMRN